MVLVILSLSFQNLHADTTLARTVLLVPIVLVPGASASSQFNRLRFLVYLTFHPEAKWANGKKSKHTNSRRLGFMAKLGIEPMPLTWVESPVWP